MIRWLFQQEASNEITPRPKKVETSSTPFDCGCCGAGIPTYERQTSSRARGGGILQTELYELPHDRRRKADGAGPERRHDTKGSSVAGAIPAKPEGDALLDMITAESKLPRSQFAGMQISDRPLTQQDVANGKLIFTGVRPLSAGGPACISCHSVRGLTLLGGGRLGPDLTRVYERLQGRKGLASWLSAPASPTMTPVFKAHAMQPEEILSLVALFEDSARKGGEADTTPVLNFFLLGLGGMVLGLVSLDLVWKKRFRGVRWSLVHKENGENGNSHTANRGER
jgi:mono/diheme cytochrome c family protein